MAQAEAAASPKVLFVVVDGIPADVIERVPTQPLMPSPWWGAMAGRPWAVQLASRVKLPRSQRRGI